jgi:penicillin V acylase-like amidase (Ntn superfamily)
LPLIPAILFSFILARNNFDWIQQGGNVHFIPPTRLYGYRTYGLCLFEQFGADRPFDGLNSEGLFVGMTGVHVDDFSPLPATSNGIPLDEFGIIRFVLERTSTTREAAAMFNGCRTVPHGVEPYVRIQYLIVDRDGECCIISGRYTSDIEKLDTDSFAALTNVPPLPGHAMSCDRLTKIQASILNIHSTEDAMDLLQQVSLESTV